MPREIINLKKIETLNLEGNPIFFPPIEIVKQGQQAIKDWFDSPKTENNEIKLILTGNTTAGKTTLVNFLTKGEYTEKTNSTHGIQITKWKIDNLNVNIWDFGGQEYYHATHRLFLTSNSVYLLLWEKSKNKTDLFPTEIMISGKEKPEIKDLQHYKYDYWLDLTRKYAKESPIFIIQNKIDDIEKGNEKEPTSDIAIRKYEVKEDYHLSIKEAYYQKDNLDSEYNLQFRIFKNNLIKTLQETAKGREIQVYIANVREKIREHAEENIWNWQQYKDFCYKEAKAEMTEQRMKILTQYLHDTGVILYYGYTASLQKTILKENVFINPSYVTKTIYNILDYKVQDNKGKFTKQQVTDKLQNKEKAETFIALMQSPNFELIFKSRQEAETYYATQYLHEENPEKDTKSFKKLSRNAEIAFVICFPNFFSLSVMNRFIARYGIDVKDNIVWKYGIIFEQNDLDVFVECKFKEQKIFVKTDIRNKTHSLIKEIFDTFTELSDNDTTIELSLDNNKFDSLENIKKYNLLEYKFLASKRQKIMPINELTGQEKKVFKIALADAFPTEKDLNLMTETIFEKRLNQIATPGNIEQQAYELISWAIAQGKLEQLMQGAVNENPDNPKLNEFLEKFKIEVNIDVENTKPQKNMSNYKQKKLNRLIIEVEETEEHLSEWKSKKRYAENPNEEARCNIEITKIDKELSILEKKIDKLENELNNTSVVKNQTEIITPSKKDVILFICSSPKGKNPLDFGAAYKTIKTAKRQSSKRDSFDIEIEAGVVADNLINLITTKPFPSIVHVSMHSSKRKGLYFEDTNRNENPMSVEKFKEIFELFATLHKPDLVILTACNSLKHAEAIKPFAKYVVGTNDFLPDEIAVLYAKKFYEMLFDGKDITFAHKAAVLSIKHSKIPEEEQERINTPIHEILTLLT